MLGEPAQCKLSSKIKIWFTIFHSWGYSYVLVVCTSLPACTLCCNWMQHVQINWIKHWKTDEKCDLLLASSPGLSQILSRIKSGCGLGMRLTQVLIPIGGIGTAWASTNFNFTQCKSQWTLYTNCKCWPKFSMSLTFWKCWRQTWVSRMMTNILCQLNITVWLWLCDGPNNDYITAKLCAPFAPKHVKKQPCSVLMTLGITELCLPPTCMHP